MTNNGTVDISQVQFGLLSGGSNAVQMVTTDLSTKTSGNLLKWDAVGNAVDSGVPAIGAAGASPILDASGDPIFDANGNWIFPG